ncbi:outer membrane beta-barrel protein, partial [Streptomyces galilaeus]|uniref:outer membrane beta-barrel protein n=1 Tax=Streptomyces galilaeus TaxID=33899 RepID=UPI0038F6E561
IVNLQQSNAFNYRESTQAGYIDFSGEIKKMSYKFGLRYERTLIDAYSKSTSSNINNNYSRLFPTVFLSYDVNEKNNLSFSYTN